MNQVISRSIGLTLSTVLAFAVVFSVAPAAHAQYDYGYDSGGGYDYGYDSGGGYNYGYDTGSGYDYGYDSGSGTGYADGTYGNGYADGTYGSGVADGTYGTGYADGTYGSGYADGTYGSGTADGTYGSGYADYCNCDTPTYTYDTYGYDSYGSSYSPGYSYGSSYYTPSYSSYTPTYYAPTYTSSRPVIQSQPTQTRTTSSQPVQQQQQQQQTATVTPLNISNVNNNTNNNNNVNTVNVATVSQATPQPVVQYVYPQTYSYPQTYTYPTYYQQPSYYPTYSQAPYCTITATTGYNGLVTLYWSSSYATSGYISPSVGSVAPNGSTSLYPYGNTVYTMTVSGPGGTNTCRTNYIPTTPSVSLTQIPYTGFDFGPLGNAVYWMSLLALALAGAYLVVYYRGGALTLATETVRSFRPQMHVAAPVASAETTVPAPVEAPVVAPKVFTFANLPAMESTGTKDAMKMTRSADGTPRIVIARG